VKAVVLVGGQGTRLRPLTLSTPKPMLPIVEVPMIERVAAHLAAHGVDEIVLSMGYRPDAFVEAFPDGMAGGARLSYAVEPEPLDTGGGIAFAARHAGLDAGDEPFLVVNGDVLSDWDLGALVAFHRSRGAEATIALTPVPDPSAFGVVDSDGDGRVRAFVEKPAPGTAPSNHVNAGFYVFEPRVVSRMPVDTPLHVEGVTFPAMAADGVLYAMASDAYWTDTGTASLFLQANLDVVAGLPRNAVPVAPGAAQRNDGVWLAGGPVIDGTVESPAFVGEAAYVGSGATVARSVIGAGARVERGALVEGSVLLPGALVHQGAEVRGSIVGAGAVIGEGARLSGLTVVQGGAEVAGGAVLDGERVVRAA
jgi:mannose-1-phosphate guanylyltransferase